MIFAINNVCVKFIVEHILMKNKLSVFSILTFVCSFNSYADFETTNTEHLLLTTAHTEIDKYLVIATGKKNDANFNASNVELGADQEVVNKGDSTPDTGEINKYYQNSSGDITSHYITTGRWQTIANTDTVGNSDYLENAKHLLENPDYSGNVALTGKNSYFYSENSDYFASLGIRCNENTSIGTCNNGDDKDNGWKESETATFEKMSANVGYSNDLEPQALLDELDAWQNEIDSITIDYAVSAITGVSSTGVEYNESLQTNLDDYDRDGDGFAVFSVNDTFKVNYSDWIMYSNSNTIAVFKMENDNQFLINTSSIMMGCSHLGDDTKDANANCSDEKVNDLGVIFYTDQAEGAVIDVTNSILGGVGLWDFAQFSGKNNGSEGKNQIKFSNSQGCIQVISEQVNMQNTRFNRCDLANATTPPLEVPEPPVVALFITGLIMLTAYRKKQIINS